MGTHNLDAEFSLLFDISSRVETKATANVTLNKIQSCCIVACRTFHDKVLGTKIHFRTPG